MQALDIITEVICNHLEEKYDICLIADAPCIYLTLFIQGELGNRTPCMFQLIFEADCLVLLISDTSYRIKLPYCYPDFLEDLDKICADRVSALTTMDCDATFCR